MCQLFCVSNFHKTFSTRGHNIDRESAQSCYQAFAA